MTRAAAVKSRVVNPMAQSFIMAQSFPYLQAEEARVGSELGSQRNHHGSHPNLTKSASSALNNVAFIRIVDRISTAISAVDNR